MKFFSKTLMNYIEKKYINKKINFKSGDIIELVYKIKDNEKERPVTHQGLVIAIKNKTVNKNFTLRQTVKGHTIDQNFFLYSPNILKIIKKII